MARCWFMACRGFIYSRCEYPIELLPGRTRDAWNSATRCLPNSRPDVLQSSETIQRIERRRGPRLQKLYAAVDCDTSI
jgi:hypothetical protein